MKYENKLDIVPVWKKEVLSLNEAVAYTGLGRHALVALANDPTRNIVLWSGRKRLYKRRRLQEFIDRSYSV